MLYTRFYFINQINFYSFTWKTETDRQTETDRLRKILSFAYSPNSHNSLGRPWLNPEVMNSFWVFHIGGRNLTTWAINPTSQGVHWQEAGVRSQSWVSNPGTLMRIAVILTGIVTTRPRPHTHTFYFKLQWCSGFQNQFPDLTDLSLSWEDQHK